MCTFNWIELYQEWAEKSLADCAALHVLMGLLTAGCTKAAATTEEQDNMGEDGQNTHTHETQRPVRSHKARTFFLGWVGKKNDSLIMQPKTAKAKIFIFPLVLCWVFFFLLPDRKEAAAVTLGRARLYHDWWCHPIRYSSYIESNSTRIIIRQCGYIHNAVIIRMWWISTLCATSKFGRSSASHRFSSAFIGRQEQKKKRDTVGGCCLGWCCYS